MEKDLVVKKLFNFYFLNSSLWEISLILRIFKMQGLRLQLQLLCNEYQHENSRLLKMLQCLSSKAGGERPRSQPSEKARSEYKERKIGEEQLENSRNTFQTVKNSNYVRCESCFTIKGSRQSNKTLTKTKKGPSQMRHESNMSRLKKISQKITPAVSNSLLLKKRSRILHLT